MTSPEVGVIKRTASKGVWAIDRFVLITESVSPVAADIFNNGLSSTVVTRSPTASRPVVVISCSHATFMFSAVIVLWPHAATSEYANTNTNTNTNTICCPQ